MQEQLLLKNSFFIKSSILKVPCSSCPTGIPWRSPGDSKGTNTKLDDLMKKDFFTRVLLFFTGKTNIQKF